MPSVDPNTKPYTDTLEPAPRPAPRQNPKHAPHSNGAWVTTQDPNLALNTALPKTNYEFQATIHHNSDSGHNSSQSSPSSPSSSTLGKKESSLAPLSTLPPIPLSSSKPRRPRSQHIPMNKPSQNRYSYHHTNNDYIKQNNQIPGDHDVQVYMMDNITYADLDHKAFIKKPENKVLPSNGLPKAAYAKIDVSKSQLV